MKCLGNTVFADSKWLPSKRTKKTQACTWMALRQWQQPTPNKKQRKEKKRKRQTGLWWDRMRKRMNSNEQVCPAAESMCLNTCKHVFFFFFYLFHTLLPLLQDRLLKVFLLSSLWFFQGIFFLFCIFLCVICRLTVTVGCWNKSSYFSSPFILPIKSFCFKKKSFPGLVWAEGLSRHSRNPGQNPTLGGAGWVPLSLFLQ